MVAPHLKRQQRDNTPPSSSPPPVTADNKKHSSSPPRARLSTNVQLPQVTNFHAFDSSSPFFVKTPATPDSDLKKAVVPFAAPSSKRQVTGLQNGNGGSDQAVALQNAVLKALRQQLEAEKARGDALQVENAALKQAAQSNSPPSAESTDAELAARCAALEAENAALKQSAQAIEIAMAKPPDNELVARCAALEAKIASLQQVAQSNGSTSSQTTDEPRGRSTTTRPVQNLTGYDTSDDEETQGLAVEPQAQQSLPSDDDIIEQILTQHANRLHTTEGSVVEIVSDYKSMKDDMRELKIRLQAAEAKESSHNHGPEETNPSLTERLNALELQTKQKQDQIDNLLAWKAAVDEDAKSATDSAIVKSVSSQNVPADAELPDLKKRVKKLERKIRQDDLIDEAPSEDLLHAYYQRLSTAWNNEQHRAGDFKGSPDEIWTLKTRCVRRLGGFSSFESALQEAQARKEYNGD